METLSLTQESFDSYNALLTFITDWSDETKDTYTMLRGDRLYLSDLKNMNIDDAEKKIDR